VLAVSPALLPRRTCLADLANVPELSDLLPTSAALPASCAVPILEVLDEAGPDLKEFKNVSNLNDFGDTKRLDRSCMPVEFSPNLPESKTFSDS